MNAWMNEGMNEWMIKHMKEQMNEWTNQCMKEWIHEWLNEGIHEWEKEWTTEGMNEQINEWMHEWINEWMNERMIEWTIEWMKEPMNKWTSERMNEWLLAGNWFVYLPKMFSYISCGWQSELFYMLFCWGPAWCTWSIGYGASLKSNIRCCTLAHESADSDLHGMHSTMVAWLNAAD